MVSVNAEFPERLAFLFQSHRYKISKGGRGSGKSWGFARALLILGLQSQLRIICAREVQKSIKDSVHRLLKDQIVMMGMTANYDVLETVIRGTNGTEFTFTGLSEHTVDSIKSYEGADICWVEEGQNVSKRSWDILTPTIRKTGSEIWVSMNPDLETDETYQRFVSNPPEDCVTITMNYIDNPWFNDVLEKERIECQTRRPDDYPNIWEGQCRPAAEGAIYYKEMESASLQGRICNVPYDPMLKAHVVVDIGWNDSMSISIVQRNTSEIRVIDYIEDSHKTLDYYSSVLKERRYNWGKLWLPHDGYSGDVKTGKSCADIMIKLGWDVPRRDEIAEMGVEDGIRVTRMTFPRIYFDRVKTERLIECAKRYRRTVSRATNEPGSPMHDEYSHGADNLRYICVNADRMTNDGQKRQRSYNRGYTPIDAAIGY